MSDLHIEKTRTSTLEQSRRLEEVTLQSGAKMAATYGWLPHPVRGGRPGGGSTNQVEPRGSYLH